MTGEKISASNLTTSKIFQLSGLILPPTKFSQSLRKLIFFQSQKIYFSTILKFLSLKCPYSNPIRPCKQSKSISEPLRKFWKYLQVSVERLSTVRKFTLIVLKANNNVFFFLFLFFVNIDSSIQIPTKYLKFDVSSQNTHISKTSQGLGNRLRLLSGPGLK